MILGFFQEQILGRLVRDLDVGIGEVFAIDASDKTSSLGQQ